MKKDDSVRRDAHLQQLTFMEHAVAHLFALQSHCVRLLSNT